MPTRSDIFAAAAQRGLRSKALDVLDAPFDPLRQIPAGMKPPLRVGDVASLAVQNAPGIGDIASIIDAYKAYAAGNPLEGSFAAIGALPMIGSVSGGPLKNLMQANIGAPELRAAPDDALHAALSQIRARNAEKGLDADIATGAIRDEIARRNAVTMLGLPEGNTAADRAGAMGFEGNLYHGTNTDFPEFSTDFAGAQQTKDWGDASYFTPSQSGASRYAIEAASSKERNDAFEKYKQVEQSEISKGWPGWGENDAVHAALNEYRAAAKSAQQTPEGAAVIPATINLSRADPHLVSDGITDPFLYKNSNMGGRNKNVALIYDNPKSLSEVAVFDPAMIRSRFAAFDPARRDEANLLASVAGLFGLSHLFRAMNPEDRGD